MTNPVARIRPDAQVSFDEAARRPDRAAAVLPDGTFVHSDPHLVVVEKPSGISTVFFDPEGMGASIARRAQKGEELTLDARVRQALAKKEKWRGDLGVVHRLDKETSGLIVFSRTWLAKKALMQAFRFRHVHRRYLAIVHGEPQPGKIQSSFVEDRGDGLRGSVEKRHGRKHAIGNEKVELAITHVEVIERLPGTHAGAPCTLIACRLETGRTHQIRIHLAEAGHPLLGDRVYSRGYDKPTIPAPRLMLHAEELGFVHPATEKEMRWTSPLPEDMKKILAWLRD